MMLQRTRFVFVLATLSFGCGTPNQGPDLSPDAALVADASVRADSGIEVPIDAGVADAGDTDSGVSDAGSSDSGIFDSGAPDAGGIDAGSLDSGAADAGSTDAGILDSGTLDAGATDAGGFDAGVAFVVTSPGTVTRTACSDAFVARGLQTDPLRFSSSSTSVTFYSDARCQRPITVLSTPSSTERFFVSSTAPGAVTITLAQGLHVVAAQVRVLNAINISENFSNTVPPSDGSDNQNRDDSPVFVEAIRLASTTLPKDFASGPLQAPQGIVYVPAGLYRILNVELLSNVRIEFNGGVEIREFTAGTGANRGLFVIDSPDLRGGVVAPGAQALQNVSLVGVGTSQTWGSGRAKHVTETGWSLNSSFFLHVDPVATGCSSQLNPIQVLWADGVLIENIASDANNSDLSGNLGNNLQNPIIKIKASGLSNSTRTYGPNRVTVRNQYARFAALGGGPIQVNTGSNLTFENIYGSGGITLRLEASSVGARTLAQHGCQTKSQGGGSLPGQTCTCSAAAPCALIYTSTIDHLRAAGIWCKNGQSAVSLVPHSQPNNTDIAVDDIRSDNCATGVTGGKADADDRLAAEGSFSGVTLSNLQVIGSNFMGSGAHAQLATPSGVNSWVEGLSETPICLASADAARVEVSQCQFGSGQFDLPVGNRCSGGNQSLCTSGTVRNY